MPPPARPARMNSGTLTTTMTRVRNGSFRSTSPALIDGSQPRWGPRKRLGRSSGGLEARSASVREAAIPSSSERDQVGASDPGAELLQLLDGHEHRPGLR